MNSSIQTETLQESIEVEQKQPIKTSQEEEFVDALKKHTIFVSHRLSEEERRYYKMVYEDMPLAGLLTSKAENVFENFEQEIAINKAKDQEQQITILEYFKAIFNKIEDRIMNSPELQEILDINKLIPSQAPE